jgi:hypothetical protein
MKQDKERSTNERHKEPTFTAFDIFEETIESNGANNTTNTIS